MAASTTQRYALIGLLALAGYMANIYAIPVTFGVAFIFGSIFSIIALVVLGMVPGVIVSLIASSYTYQLWNHPYAIVIFACEILWLGYFLKKKKRNFLLIDLSFWLFAGSVLVFFFYEGIMGLGFQHASLIVLKQSINGALNTTLAWIFLSFPTVAAKLNSPLSKRRITSEHVLFQLATVFLLISALGMLLLISDREVRKVQKEAVQSLYTDSHAIADIIHRWIDQHILAIRKVTEEVRQKEPLVSSRQLQMKVQMVQALFPDFQTIFIGDNTAGPLALHPTFNEKKESTADTVLNDRAWFKELSTSLKPTVSEIIWGRGGIYPSIFTISVPAVRNGTLSHFGLGTISLDKMAKVLTTSISRTGRIYTVIDRSHKVIVSTDPDKAQLYNAKLLLHATKMDMGNNVILVVPGTRKNISTMEAYKGAYYHATVPITNTPWHLSIELPVAPIQHHHYQNAIWGLGATMLLLLVMSTIMMFLGKYITSSLHDLGKITIGLPQKIKNQRHITWPTSHLEEVHRLIKNFQSSADSLSYNFAEISRINADLEKAIANRTKQLRQEQERLKEIVNERDIILENTTVGISVVRQRKQVWSNRALQELLGHTNAEMDIPTRIFYRSEEEYEKLGAEAYPILASGDSYHVDTVMCRADGSEVIVSLHGRAINPEAPQEGSIWIFEDITERKLMEKALQQSETKFRQLFQVAAIPLYLVGQDGGTLALNSKFVEVFGYEESDIPTLEVCLEKTLPDPNYRQKAIANWEAARKKALTERTDLAEEEYEVTCKNGEVRSVLIGGSAIDVHFLATFVDITVIKRANRELEAANRAKSIFLSSMSHELRTPLNAILGYTQIFNMDGSLSRKQQLGIQTIHQAAEHLLMIINDVLDMSKIEAGKLRLVKAELELLPFLESIIDFFTNSAQEKDLDISLEAERTLLPKTILADELRLRQVIYNLISNSLKFTRKGFCTLRAEASPRGTHRSLLTISVEDSGIGIPKENQSDIFKPFTQIGEHLQHESGTGLGLAISRQLAQMMGGDISLESPALLSPAAGEGGGCRFSLTFETEVIESTHVIHAPETRKPIGYTHLEDQNRQAKILIVDDNFSNRAVLTETLTPLGFTISEAVDGSMVVEAALKTNPDLILMDLRMPKTDGFSALEQCMQDQRLKTIPVIAITASVLEEVDLSHQCLQHGFKDLIQKPYDVMELLLKIENLLPISLVFQVSGNDQDDEDLNTIEIPPAEEIKKLEKYLAEGDIDALIARAETIGIMNNGGYKGYSRLLRTAAENFNFSKLEELISGIKSNG